MTTLIALTETGNLPVGILIEGTRHTAFTLRLGNMADHLDIISAVGPAPADSNDGTAAYRYNTRFNIASFAQRLSMPTLPESAPNPLTLPYLLGNLDPDDFNYLFGADIELKKKRDAWPIAGQPCST
jgi:hypothetical protein